MATCLKHPQSLTHTHAHTHTHTHTHTHVHTCTQKYTQTQLHTHTHTSPYKLPHIDTHLHVQNPSDNARSYGIVGKHFPIQPASDECFCQEVSYLNLTLSLKSLHCHLSVCFSAVYYIYDMNKAHQLMTFSVMITHEYNTSVQNYHSEVGF